MITAYSEAAAGTTQTHDDMTDRLYELREFLSCHAFNDAEAYTPRFSKFGLTIDALQAFDRFIESTIETYSGMDTLPPDEIKKILNKIEELGQVYSNILADNSGSEDCGRSDKFRVRVTALNSLKEFFVRMSANLNVPVLSEELRFENV